MMVTSAGHGAAQRLVPSAWHTRHILERQAQEAGVVSCGDTHPGRIAHAGSRRPALPRQTRGDRRAAPVCPPARPGRRRGGRGHPPCPGGFTGRRQGQRRPSSCQAAARAVKLTNTR